jgi:ribosomal protein L14E/L6E/L27E
MDRSIDITDTAQLTFISVHDIVSRVSKQRANMGSLKNTKFGAKKHESLTIDGGANNNALRPA